MGDLSPQLREAARSLLRDEKVDLIIGYEEGTLPLRTSPCFIRSPDEAERLVWNPCCDNNLATYLHRATGKVGIVAKGCDARSIVGEIVERQIAREDVIVIGVPCQGVIDRAKIEAQLDGREALEADVSEGKIALRGEGFEETLNLAEVLCDGCATCRHRNPPLYDILIGEPTPEMEDADEYAAVRALEDQTPDERWAYFAHEFSRCIRCYACREACPCCYCAECFVDQTQPCWFSKGDDLSDVMAFHIVRAYHVAGRCLDCGACVRACPMQIDLRVLVKKLEKDVRELYGYEAGLHLETAPSLTTFQPDDQQEFIK